MSQPNRELPPGAIAALNEGKRIKAVRLIRDIWGVDRPTAAAAINSYVAAHPDLQARLDAGQGKRRRGCLVIVLIIVVIIVAIVYMRRH